MHPRVSVSAISTLGWPLEEDLAFWVAEGITRVGITTRKLDAHGREAGIGLVLDTGVEVTNLLTLSPLKLTQPSRWPEAQETLLAAVLSAATLRAGCLVMTTGRAAPMPWEEAADAYAVAIAPVVEAADRLGVRLALEHTHALRCDIGFVHTLRDCVDLARRVGIGVCLEVQACWAERDLATTIGKSIDTVRLVQVSDFLVGTLGTPDRVAVGDGNLPLARLLAQLEASGYEGTYDLELIGPVIEEEGYAPAIRRSLTVLDDLLSLAGA